MPLPVDINCIANALLSDYCCCGYTLPSSYLDALFRSAPLSSLASCSLRRRWQAEKCAAECLQFLWVHLFVHVHVCVSAVKERASERERRTNITRSIDTLTRLWFRLVCVYECMSLCVCLCMCDCVRWVCYTEFKSLDALSRLFLLLSALLEVFAFVTAHFNRPPKLQLKAQRLRLNWF